MTRFMLVGMLALAACTQAPPPTGNATVTPEPAAVPTFPLARNFVGRWTGVEGMFLEIAATDRPDRYRLTMQYDLDHRQTVDARLNVNMLEFERNGTTRRLVPSDGWATGLKHLSGKKDCLTVAYGEGYCRD